MPALRWSVFDDALPLLTCSYSFGPGTATSIAVRGQDGILVVSPPCGATGETFAGVARLGPVRALVAPNAYHTLGIAEWKARFPEAEVFAPAQSAARVAKVAGQEAVRPVAAIASLAGDRVRFFDMPHYRTGEALVAIDTGRGLAWYVTDAIFNFRVLPDHPVARLVFRATRSGPGLRFNNVARLFMMKSGRAVRRWIAAEMRRQRPRWIIPAHGEVVDVEAERGAVDELLRGA